MGSNELLVNNNNGDFGKNKIKGETDYQLWTVTDVGNFLFQQGLGHLIEVFTKEKISGDILLLLNDYLLREIGISSLGDRIKVMGAVDKLRSNSQIKSKIINDPVHGTLAFHPFYFQIIDTPKFQRLRYIKQLGSSCYVYPGATNSRFEHSLGVCHIAEMMVRNLQQKQPELGITEKDVLCVAIGGLCHDLGHGPFSHLWEKFMNTAKPDKNWKHELASVQIFEHIWQNISEEVKADLKFGEDDLIFIKELIYGPNKVKSKEWLYQGRSKDKSFLYEIVANRCNGIDVDKWDYFLRDCHYLGFEDTFDYQRILKSARVIKDEESGLRHICFRDKEAFNLYQMFHTRWVLHRRAYQHRVVRIIDKMLIDALLLVDEIIKLPGSDGELLSLSQCSFDVEAFSKLNDFIVHRIMLESEPVFMKNIILSEDQKKKLFAARKILERIEKRNLYAEVGCVLLPEENEVVKETIKKTLEKEISNNKDVVYVDIIKIDYGMEDHDPIHQVKFYNKAAPNLICFRNEEFISRMLPCHFQEEMLYCLCLSEDAEMKALIKKRFENWCNKNCLHSI